MNKHVVICDYCGKQRDYLKGIDYDLTVPFSISTNENELPQFGKKYDFCSVRCLQSWIDKYLEGKE